MQMQVERLTVTDNDELGAELDNGRLSVFRIKTDIVSTVCLKDRRDDEVVLQRVSGSDGVAILVRVTRQDDLHVAD